LSKTINKIVKRSNSQTQMQVLVNTMIECQVPQRFNTWCVTWI